MAFDSTRLIDRRYAAPFRLVFALWMLAGWSSFASAQKRPFWQTDPFANYKHAMYERPKLQLDSAYEVHLEGLKELWLKALARPDAQLQRMVVDTLAIAHHRGVPGLEDTADRLTELLKQPETRQDVRRAVAQTLVEFDAKQYADVLAELMRRDGPAVAPIVEPALADWKSNAIQDEWMQRIREGSAGPESLSMAIEGLSALGVSDAAEFVERLVRDPGQPTRVRMVAARHMGRFRAEGMPELGKQLMDQPDKHATLSALLAIELLAWDESESAVEVLTGFVDDARSVVQSRALSRLLEIDYTYVDQHAEELVTSDDSTVRRIVAQAMFESKRVDRIELLANLLDDVVPSLRDEVASGLIAAGNDESLREEVFTQVMRIINQDAWRGCEKACVVLTELDHKPSGTRMTELLKHPRSEVKVVSAWGLARLRIPEHLPDMLDHANGIYEAFRSNRLDLSARDAVHQLGHLFIAFGDQNYQPAESLVRAYVPRNDSLGDESRTAAAWAIGMFHIDDPDPEILAMLAERIRDIGMLPEREETRWMAAISIGRMKGESELPTLRQFARGTTLVNRACQWAVSQITGEPQTQPGRVPVLLDSYFLMPLDAEAK